MGDEIHPFNCDCANCKHHQAIHLEHMRENKAVIERLYEKIKNVYDAFKDKQCLRDIPCQLCDDYKRCQSIVALKDVLQ